MSEPVKFEVPDIPLNINGLMRLHWACRGREKDKWASLLWAATHPAKIRQLRAWEILGERVRITMVVHHKGVSDPDNTASYGKIPLDAMKQLGMIRDDSKKFVEFRISQVESYRKRTTFEIRKVARRSA